MTQSAQHVEELWEIRSLPGRLLGVLELYIGAHVELLTLLEKDARQQAQTNIPTAFALDYQAMYCYAYPHADSVTASRTVAYLIDNSNLQFFLPSGSIVELLHHLSIKMLHSLGLSARNSDLDMEQQLQRDFSLFEIVDWIPGDPKITEFMANTAEHLATDPQLTKKLRRQVNEMKRTAEGLGRFASLVSRGNVRGISDAVDHPELLRFAHDVYFAVLEGLEALSKNLHAYKRRSQYNNAADAANVASIISIRDYAEQAHTEMEHDASVMYNLFLLSDTSALTNDRVWSDRAFVDRNLGPFDQSETVRFPVVALYWSILNERVSKEAPCATPAQLGKLLLSEIELRKSRYQSVLAIIHSSDNWPPQEPRAVAASGIYDIDRLYDRVQGNTRLRHALATLREHVTDKEGQQFDEIVTLDDRSHELGHWKRDWEFADHISEGYEAFQALGLLSSLMSVAEDLQRAAGNVIGLVDEKVQSLAMGYHSRLDGVLEEKHRHEYINFSEYTFSDLDLKRLTFTSLSSANQTRDLVLEIDVYPSHYCVSWLRGRSLRTAVAQLDSILMKHDCLENSIALLYGNSEELELPLGKGRSLTSSIFDEGEILQKNPDEAGGEMFQMNPFGWYFLKVITNRGDFCFDLVPCQDQRRLYVSFASNKTRQELIQEFWTSSSILNVPPSTIRNIVDENLKLFM